MSQYNARVFVAQNADGTDAVDADGNLLAYIAEPGFVPVTGVVITERYIIRRGWLRYRGPLSALSSDCSVLVPNTQPVFNVATTDWNITQAGIATKTLGVNEFTLVPGVSYTYQAFVVSGNVLTSLPGYLTFSGPSRMFTANIPAGMANPNLTIRVVVSDPSGSAAQDEFSLTVTISSTPPPSVTTPILQPVAHYDLVSSTTPPVTPDYLIKLDFNACDAIGGWVIDKNNKLAAAQVDIKVDGALYLTLTANVSRPDVRDYLISQGILPAGTTFAMYGFTHTKDSTFANGVSHSWQVYGHNSTTESTTDTNAPSAITCGTPAQSITGVARSVRGGSIYHYVKVSPYDADAEVPVWGRARVKTGSNQGAWGAWARIQRIADNSQFTPDNASAQGYQLAFYSLYVNNSTDNDYTLDVAFSLTESGSSPVNTQYYFPAVGSSNPPEIPTPETLHTVYTN